MRRDQELELLFGRRVRDQQRDVANRQPRGSAGNRKAVVAREAEAVVAELVQDLAPAAVAAVDGQGADAFFGPGDGGEGVASCILLQAGLFIARLRGGTERQAVRHRSLLY